MPALSKKPPFRSSYVYNKRDMCMNWPYNRQKYTGVQRNKLETVVRDMICGILKVYINFSKKKKYRDTFSREEQLHGWHMKVDWIYK